MARSESNGNYETAFWPAFNGNWVDSDAIYHVAIKRRILETVLRTDGESNWIFIEWRLVACSRMPYCPYDMRKQRTIT